MERDRQWILPGAVIAGAVALWALLLSLTIDYPARPSGSTSITALIFVVAIGALWRFSRYFFGLWRAGVDRPFARIRIDMLPALIGFMPVVLGCTIIGCFFYSITYLKSMIVALVPFWADDPLAAIDRALHIDPEALARAFQPFLPALGLFYGLWHVMHVGGILWVLHWRGGNKALHILSFMLTWTIGMALAFAFSSAGPIFTGGYDPSLAPESVQRIAQLLWANYEARGALLGGGISAFPSMHVAIAAWFALVLRDRGLPMLGYSYALAVFFCSIVLGWHYFADSVAGAVIAIAASQLSRWWLAHGSGRRPATGPAPAAS